MTTEKPIFTSFSLIRLGKTLLFRTLILFIILFISHELQADFDWNFFGVGILLLIFFIIIDPKELKIYSDKIQIQTNFLFGLVHTKAEFKIADIENIEVKGGFSRKSDLMSDLITLLMVPFPDAKNTLEITTKDQIVHSFHLRVYKEELMKGIGLIEN